MPTTKTPDRHAHLCPDCRQVFFCWCDSGWSVRFATCERITCAPIPASIDPAEIPF